MLQSFRPDGVTCANLHFTHESTIRMTQPLFLR